MATLLSPRISSVRGTEFPSYVCSSCRCRFTTPKPVSLSYDEVQRHHVYYYEHELERVTVRTYLNGGNEVYWLAKAVDYLSRRSERRHNQVLEMLVSTAFRGERLTVLEIGANCGTIGAIAVRLGHRYLGIDTQEGMMRQAAREFGETGAEFRWAPEDWIFNSDNESFDLVYAAEVIEHVLRPREFLSALIRLVAPGGFGLLTTPDAEVLATDTWAKTDLPPLHQVLLTKRSVCAELERQGFENRYTAYNEDLSVTRMKSYSVPTLGDRDASSGEACPEMDPKSPHYYYGAGRQPASISLLKSSCPWPARDLRRCRRPAGNMTILFQR
jgi:2-polyprenyl-3-methyl-5-hydroxy-6-metoxy-1,4-benzoquinol methylase